MHKDGPIPEHAPHLGPCWVWTGPSDRKGYGRWSRILAHRHSWMLANGPISGDLWVLHHCDNPPCVNPHHLYLGTVVENVRDAVERGRMSNQHLKNPRTHCRNGHLLAGDNIRIVGARRQVKCRICDNERSRVLQEKKRRAAGAQPPNRLSAEEAARIVALRNAGRSVKEIKLEIGRSEMAVRRVLSEQAA